MEAANRHSSLHSSLQALPVDFLDVMETSGSLENSWELFQELQGVYCCQEKIASGGLDF